MNEYIKCTIDVWEDINKIKYVIKLATKTNYKNIKLSYLRTILHAEMA